MSLNFAASTSARVDHGSGASLDNLNPVTMWAWVYRTANGSNQEIITKDGALNTGPLFIVDNAPGEGALRLFRWMTGTNTDFASTAGAVPLNVQMFVAMTYDSSLATFVDLYTGTLVRPVTEVTYSTAINGTGTIEDDSASLLYVGNVQRSPTSNFKGRIGWYGVVNRRLTQGELEQIRTAPTIYDCRVSGTVLLSGWQDTTATQIDVSGLGNHGTVTAATVHEPLPWRPYDVPIVGRRAAAVFDASLFPYPHAPQPRIVRPAMIPSGRIA